MKAETVKLIRDLNLNLMPMEPKEKMPVIIRNTDGTPKLRTDGEPMRYSWTKWQTEKCDIHISEERNGAIICGRVAGCSPVVVIDIDSPELKDIIFDDFETIKKQTLIVETGKGGYHVFVRPKDDEKLQTKRLTNDKGQHIDIQADRVYVMAPSSIHPNGNEYKIISSTTQIKEITVNKFIQGLEQHGFNTDARGLGSIEEISKGVREGSISDSCFKYSCHLLSKVGLDKETAWKEILRWYDTCIIDDKNRSLPKLKSTFSNAVKRVEHDGLERTKIKKMQPVSQAGWQELLNTYICDNQLYDELNNKFIVNVDDEKLQECMKKYPASFYDMICEAVKECGMGDSKVELSMTPNIKLGEIKPSVGDKILCFDCEITATEERQTYTLKADYECSHCKKVETLRVNEQRYIPITRCSCRKKEKLSVVKGTIIGDYVRIVWIAESLDEAKNNTPQHFRVRMFGDIVSETFVGQRKRIIGQFKSLPMTGDFNEVVIDTINVSGLDDKQAQLASEEEVKYWQDKIREDGDKFLANIADEYYTVIGNEEVKQAGILSSVGAPPTSRKINKIPVLLLGDPGAAKSTILEETLEFNYKHILTGGKGNSAAGLTGGMDRPAPNMPMVFLPGALTIANNGMAGIDEIDKMYKHDRESLLIAMAKGHVPINKVGVHGVLPTNTTIFATANPTGGRWKDGVPVLDQTELSEPLLSRFVLIFLVKDEIDEYKDTMISNHIMKQMSSETEKKIDVDKLMRYITYLKQFNPQLTEKAMKAITDYYVRIRALSTSQHTIPIDPRKTEGLAVLAMANARLLMKHEADEVDVKVATGLFEKSLESFGITIDETGKVHEMLKTNEEMSKEEKVWECIDIITDNGEHSFTESEFVDALSNTKFFDKHSALKERYKWEAIGRIYLNQDGSYRK